MNSYLFQTRGKLKPLWNKLWPVREFFRKSRLAVAGLLRQLPVSSMVLGPPKRCYETTRKWLDTASSKEDGTVLVGIHSSSMAERVPPKSVSDLLHWKFAKELNHKSSESFVAVIPKGRYWGYYGGNVITPDDNLLEDLSKDIRPGNDHEVFLQLKLPDMERYRGTVAVISAPESESNYFHWMFDVLPRIKLLSEAGFGIDEIDRFVTNMTGLPFQVETLASLGVPSEKLIKASRGLHLQADRLIVPSATINSSFDTPGWVCSFLQELLVGGTKRVATFDYPRAELLYITRRNASYRRIVNEGEVANLLDRLGFCTIVLEQLSVVEQSALFANAKMIVSVHGAGLTNLVCCAPQTKVIEMFSPNFVQTNYWGISCAMGLEYYYLFGEGPHPPPPIDPLNRYSDLRVDLVKLEDTLKLAGLKVR